MSKTIFHWTKASLACEIFQLTPINYVQPERPNLIMLVRTETVNCHHQDSHIEWLVVAHIGLLWWLYCLIAVKFHMTVLGTVIRLLQTLMLLLVISSLPNVLTACYSALYCPSNHSDINANVIEKTLHESPWAHVAQHFYRLCNCVRKQCWWPLLKIGVSHQLSIG